VTTIEVKESFKMPYIRSSRKRGFALSIVLWIVAALLFGIATLSSLSKDTIGLSKGLQKKLKTELTAEDVLESFKFYLLTASYDNNSLQNATLDDFRYKFPKKLIVDGRWYAISRDINISITDVSALLHVNYASPKSIAFILTDNDQRQLRYTIADSLKDWKDKDNSVSLNGAENSKYELQKGVNYKIRNNPAIQSVAELRLVNGIDAIAEKKWKKLKQNFYYGNGSAINLTLISAKYLAYILKLNSIEANALVNVRKQDLQKFIESVNKLKTFDDDMMGFFQSRAYKIKVVVNFKGARSVLTTIIDFRKTRDHLYTVISYKLL